LGAVSSAETRRLLSSLFDADLDKLCVVYGGDWAESVNEQWAQAGERPTSAANLRNVGTGGLDLDGLVAIVAVDRQGIGHVRRAFLGGECTDHSRPPPCLSIEDIEGEIVQGSEYVAGPFAGRRGRAIELKSRARGAGFCPLEPEPEAM
jgi:hypothetical protein